MSLFQYGNFKLNSGKVSKWKLECDSLTQADLRTLAYLISVLVGPFHHVEGVPRGGLLLAEHLKEYCTICNNLLIVDDVLTTGNSMERLRNQRKAKGAVIFVRGQCPGWVKPLFQMPKELYAN